MDKIINYDNILNPNEALESYIKNLVPLYIEDYGEENLNLVEDRIDKTLYIFDSLPVDEINFFAEHEDLAEKSGRVKLAYEECRDFLKKKRRIENKMDQKIYEALAEAYEIGSRYIEELLDLDVGSYAAEVQLALIYDTTPENIKEIIRKRQYDYQMECKRLGIKCLTDAKVIGKLFNLREKCSYEINLFLAKYTKWAKRISKRITDWSGIVISDVNLVDLLFYVGTASTSVVDVGRREPLRVCYFPLIANTYRGNLDGMFFHENRHAVEMDKKYAGLQIFASGKYSSLNEIRTEKNALRDKKRLENNVLFSNEGFINDTWNVYERLFSYTNGFFDEQLEVLNKLAVLNDIKEFEKIYGKRNLKRFDGYLSNIQMALGEDKLVLPVNEEYQKVLVNRLREHSETRH